MAVVSASSPLLGERATGLGTRTRWRSGWCVGGSPVGRLRRRRLAMLGWAGEGARTPRQHKRASAKCKHKLMRTDPADTGGLFVGRRPGTAPIRFRTLPHRAGEMRQRVDGSLAGLLLMAMEA